MSEMNSQGYLPSQFNNNNISNNNNVLVWSLNGSHNDNKMKSANVEEKHIKKKKSTNSLVPVPSFD